MPSILLISIRFHEGRYHGTGDWPPTPARLFQALIAGAGLQGSLQVDQVKALEWLETMPHPSSPRPSSAKVSLLAISFRTMTWTPWTAIPADRFNSCEEGDSAFVVRC